MLALVATSATAGQWVLPSQLAANAAAPAPTPQPETFAERHIITSQEIETAVKDALQKENLADNISASLHSHAAGVIYQHKKPLQLKLHALSVSANSQAWQAEAYMISEHKTIAVIPVSGRYETLRRLPVLSRSMNDADVISKDDIAYVELPEQRVNKNAIQTADALIGLSPKNRISAGRPIRAHEVTKPRMVEKNGQVALIYSTEHLTIHGVGQALENGTMGDLIRIKNIDSGRAITAKVIDHNKVEVNLARAL